MADQSAMTRKDQRRSPRVCVAAVVAREAIGRLNNNNQALGTVKNVSRHGIGLETGQPPMRGQVVVLRLALNDVVHELRTRAIRVTKRGDGNFYDVGLDWSNCSEEQLSFLDEILRVVDEQPLG